MSFCDFCQCKQCQTGDAPFHYTHAPTADGRWICEVCWSYDVCGRERVRLGETKYKSAPCEDARGRAIPDCPHRPKLVGPWTRKDGSA